MLSEEDHRWVESVRQRHDPQADRIRAHFTMVFPCDADVDEALANVSAAGSSSAPIPFTILRTEAVRNAIGGGASVFLVPDEHACGRLITLHDRLYRGVLNSHLRHDVTFEPHVTVAADNSLERCQALARELSERCRSVSGTVDAIELLDVGSHPVTTIHRVALGRGGLSHEP